MFEKELENLMQKIKHKNPLLFTGFECSKIVYGCRQDGTEDVLATTAHDKRFRSDLRRVKEAGVTFVRCPVPWHRIEREPGRYDWKWLDAYMAAYREFGLIPIADLAHHTAIPSYLKYGYADPEFVGRFMAFVREFYARYPWIEWVTPINEPCATAHLCDVGYWDRHKPDYWLIIKQMGQAICASSRFLHERGVKVMHTDPAQHFQVRKRKNRYLAEARNEWRFTEIELFLGLISESDPRHAELLERYGFNREELKWFRKNPAHIDVYALDYYMHCELLLDHEGKAPPARGLAPIFLDYYERLGQQCPAMQFAIGEFNVRENVFGRLTWAKFILEEARTIWEKLGDRYFGTCAYPFIDCTDWCSCLRHPNRNIDPQGMFLWVEEGTLRRVKSLLFRWMSDYAKGKVSEADFPVYGFSADMHNRPDRLLWRFERWGVKEIIRGL
ncbi:MAG TPA: beta-galactosidase [Verrucomicrobiae bacterium]|nr:beta-galactosidase [Verrucomicrobiae bacterium]